MVSRRELRRISTRLYPAVLRFPLPRETSLSTLRSSCRSLIILLRIRLRFSAIARLRQHKKDRGHRHPRLCPRPVDLESTTRGCTGVRTKGSSSAPGGSFGGPRITERAAELLPEMPRDSLRRELAAKKGKRCRAALNRNQWGNNFVERARKRESQQILAKPQARRSQMTPSR